MLFAKLLRRKQKSRGHLRAQVTRAGELTGFDVVSPLLPSEMEPVLDEALKALGAVGAKAREARVERLVHEAKKRAGLIDKLRGRAAERIDAARRSVPVELFEGQSEDGRVAVTLDGGFGYVRLVVAPGTPVDAALAGVRQAYAAAVAEVERCWTSVLDEARGEAPEAPDGPTG